MDERYTLSIGTRERDVASLIDGYDAEIASIEDKFSGQFEEIKQTRVQQLEILNNTALIAGWESDLDELRDQRVTLRDDINTAVGDNQIYRMAALFSDAILQLTYPKTPSKCCRNLVWKLGSYGCVHWSPACNGSKYNS